MLRHRISPLLAALLVTCAGCLGGQDFPDAPCPEAPASNDDYSVAFSWMPAHLHQGDVAMFMFKVSRQGLPSTGLAPTLSYLHIASGATGEVPVRETSPGQYDGERAFFGAGEHRLTFSFQKDGAAVRRTYSVVIEAH